MAWLNKFRVGFEVKFVVETLLVMVLGMREGDENDMTAMDKIRKTLGWEARGTEVQRWEEREEK